MVKGFAFWLTFLPQTYGWALARRWARAASHQFVAQDSTVSNTLKTSSSQQAIPSDPLLNKLSTPADWFAENRNNVLPDADPVLSEKRRDGQAMLDLATIPSRRQEAWRFSNLNVWFGNQNLKLASPSSSMSISYDDIKEHLIDECSGAQLVFVDGALSETLSDTSKIEETWKHHSVSGSSAFAGTLTQLSAVCGNASSVLLERVLKELDFLPEISYSIDPRTCSGSSALSALNQACVSDVALAAVGPGGSLPHIQFLFVTSGSVATINNPRCLFLCDTGMVGELEVTQSYLTVDSAGVSHSDDNASFSNGLTRVVMDEGASMKHTYVQEAAANALHYDCIYVDIKGDNAKHHLQAISLGAYQSRINYDAVIDGEDSLAKIDCVFLASERQSMDLHSAIIHKAPNSFSEQQHRNIVCDRAEAIFKGRIRVEQLAQGTDSDQLCRSLLLTDGARVSMMPSMEIIADQVKCAHGATVADLSEEQLFYLQSRGFTTSAARAILVGATVFEFASKLPCGKLRARVASKIDEVVPRIQQASEGAEFSSI